jgi:single-strand DNA-binding protein
LDINRIVVCGRLVRDPELKNVGGYDLCSFTIASSKKTKDKNIANFFDITLWGKLAPFIAEFSRKGKQVIVDGRLDQQTWEGQDGSKKSKMVIIY